MINKHYKKKKANEIGRRLKGLSFSCRPVLIKKTFFSLGKTKYIIKTDAPEIITKDVTKEMC